MKPWHALDIEETRTALEQEPKNTGPNRLEDTDSIGWPVMLVRQFKSLLVAILLIAVFLSWLIGDKIDAVAILAIIVLNAGMGFAQEWKAETALKNLKKMLGPRCRVIRNGREIEIDAETLAAGDHILLASGEAVPADIRLTAATNLDIDESSLTGESVAVAKHTGILPENTEVAERRNMVFMGTHIVNGHGEGLVVAIGMDTEFGRIAGLTGTIKETRTGLQKHLALLARQLGAMALAIAAAVFLIGWLGGHDIVQMAMTGISLAVAAVPEGLPAVVTITLALGMGAMARKKALLRHLQAAETLGAVSVICTDKTGTLTKNEMIVQKIWLPEGEISITGAGYGPSGEFTRKGRSFEPQHSPGLMAFLDTGRKCNRAHIEKIFDGWRAVGSPTEAALLVVAEKAGLPQDHRASLIAEHSFSSGRKRMSVIEETDGALIAHVKGAPESLLPLCECYRIDGEDRRLDEVTRRRIEQAYMDFAKKGLRTLMLARKILPKNAEISEKEVESGLVFLGVAGLIDPPRPEVKDALIKAKSAGIRVVLITGDSPDTARAVAEQVGLSVGRVVTGAEMKALPDEILSDLLQHDILFARVVPEDKYRIVRLLQSQNQLVAMTGDGVNDAPALKQADIGIAMGVQGTDVARGAADIVLTDDNFATIVTAIEEGRRQYTNIRKFVHFLVSHSVGEVSAVFLNILTGGPLILLPIQILWINIATDSVTALALSVERAERDIMSEPPRALNRPLIDKAAGVLLAAFGLYVGFATLALYEYYSGHSHALANSVAFTAIVVTAQVLVFNFRHLHGPISAIGWLSNPWLLLAVSSMIALQAAALYIPGLREVLHTVPLSGTEWVVIILVALPLFLLPEIFKIFAAQRRP